MKKSKYLNKEFDHSWICTHVGVANVSGAFYKGTRKRTKRPGHRNYYYIFERVTSDNKAEKLIRLSAYQARKVYLGKVQVEDLAKARARRNVEKFTSKISYHFYN